jgi:hypothetical protein
VADEPTSSGWLPPRAPGAQPTPMFEPAPPEPELESEAPQAAVARPAFAPRGESNGLAVTSLVLGIIGIALLLLSLGIAFLFTLPCSIAAWITGAQARARIAVGETQAGRGQAQAGYVLGILGVVLAVIAIIVWVALLAGGFDLEEFRRDLERQSNPDEVQALLGR